MMKKLTVILSIFLIGVVSSVLAGSVKVGMVLPLSGGLAQLGEDMRDAVLMMLDEDPVLGEGIELIVEDDQSQPRYAAAAAKKLIDVDKVQGVVSFYGYGGNAVAPLCERAGVLHMAITLDKKASKGPYSYGLTPSPESSAATMVPAFKALGYSKITIFVTKSQGPLQLAGALEKLTLSAGIEVARSEFQTNEKELRTLMSKELQQEEEKSDMWVLVAYPPAVGVFMSQYHQLGLDVPLSSIYSFDYLDDRSVAKGMWYVRTPLPSESYVERFFARYGRREFAPITTYGADGFRILANALIENKGDIESAKEVLDGLANAWGTGAYYTVDQSIGYFDSQCALVRIDDALELEEITAEDLVSDLGE